MTTPDAASRPGAAKHSFFRKSLVLPAEHGAWAWLMVPFVVGSSVAGQLHPAIILTLVGGLAAFLMRQPATIWLRIRQGRGRRRDEPLARGWTVGLALVGLLALLGLLALQRTAILWLLPPLGLLLAFYLWAALSRQTSVRTLWMELAGAAGLAAMAPAGYIAATGQIDATAWNLWALLAGQNVLGALYVRQRIADTHQRPMNRMAILLAHLGGLLLAAGLVWIQPTGWPALLPFAAFLLRAGWLALAPRPVANVKRFGFLELGIEILGGLCYIAAF